jgi:HKD family nuclease
MKQAISTSVASAYMSSHAIDEIKAVLSEMPNSGGRNFRFLLGKEFHANPSMRQVLINKLLELPNVQVKVYKGQRTFHPKLYIYEQGNELFF